MEKVKIITVLGPTASGKTKLGIELAKKFNGEIISADSMQIYKGMDIATAKPNDAEMQGIKHHLIDFLPQNESYSVALFKNDAEKIISDIVARGKNPIIVGGTGLYIDSLLNNVDLDSHKSDDKIREDLFSLLEEKGLDFLLDSLKVFDIESYNRLSVERNPKRIIRAIEVYKVSGKTFTEINKLSLNDDSPYDTIKIGLKAENREFLYDRINRRVDIMVSNGLIDEAKEILGNNLSETACKAIGYKELIPYFSGEQPLEFCIDKLKTDSRHYAKRQLTWFMRDKSINWFDIDICSFEEIFDKSVLLIKEGFYE